MRESARKVVRICMGAKMGEKFLVLTDTTRKEIGNAIYREALKVTEDTTLVVMPPTTHHGAEPCNHIANLMKEYDIIVIPTLYSLSHTHARKRANDAGARIATMPMITQRMFSKGGMTADFNGVKRRANTLHKKIMRGEKIVVRNERGLNIEMVVKKDKWILDTGILRKPGDFGNLPAGEVFAPPEYESTNGKLIIDGSMSGIGKLRNPIRIEVKNGYAIKIEGGDEAKKLRKALKNAERKSGRNVYNIAEIGIGINPRARLIGNPLEDEKVLGTIHIALGDNSTFGGNVMAGIHLDGIIKSASLIVDDVRIV